MLGGHSTQILAPVRRRRGAHGHGREHIERAEPIERTERVPARCTTHRRNRATDEIAQPATPFHGATTPKMRLVSPTRGLLMKASIRDTVLGFMVVPILMITLCLSACADPAAPRTVLGDEPSWASQVPVVGNAPAGEPQHLVVVITAGQAEARDFAVSDPASGMTDAPAQSKARFAIKHGLGAVRWVRAGSAWVSIPASPPPEMPTKQESPVFPDGSGASRPPAVLPTDAGDLAISDSRRSVNDPKELLERAGPLVAGVWPEPASKWAARDQVGPGRSRGPAQASPTHRTHQHTGRCLASVGASGGRRGQPHSARRGRSISAIARHVGRDRRGVHASPKGRGWSRSAAWRR